MKIVTLTLIGIIISSCKSLSKNTISRANYNNEYRFHKEQKIKKDDAMKVLDRDLHLNTIHDSIRKKN